MNPPHKTSSQLHSFLAMVFGEDPSTPSALWWWERRCRREQQRRRQQRRRARRDRRGW